MFRRVAILMALAVAVTTVPVGAEHTVDTRYVVLGFVKDARGKLIRGREVEVIRNKTGFTYTGVTDHQGFFVIVVRLADDGAGETLTVRVDQLSTSITARFDPANHTEDRGTRVDLDGSKFIERTAAFRPTLVRFMASGTD